MPIKRIYPPGYVFKGGAIMVREVDGVLRSTGYHRRMATLICPKCNKEWTTDLNQAARGLRLSCLKCRLVSRKTHGLSHTRSYTIWTDMISRCYKNHDISFGNYGARGITVCDRWHRFENFFSDMGEAPEGMSIDRINNDGNYSPSNCKWVKFRDQHTNKKTNRWVVINGERMIAVDAAIKYGIPKSTLWGRLNRGIPIEDAIRNPSDL